MQLSPTRLPEVLILTPEVHRDRRGFFMETWRDEWLRERGLNWRFVQENHSKSVKGTLRGLHYQVGKAQGKLVRVVAGEIFDVAVDLRKNSEFYGQWVGVTLSAENRRLLWIPPGFAHGFYVVAEMAEVIYKCTEYYSPEHERSLLWNDPALGIQWPLADEAVMLSEKDRAAPPLSEAEPCAL